MLFSKSIFTLLMLSVFYHLPAQSTLIIIETQGNKSIHETDKLSKIIFDNSERIGLIQTNGAQKEILLEKVQKIQFGIKDIENKATVLKKHFVQAWPNPNSGLLYINHSIKHPKTGTLRIFSLEGKLIYKYILYNNFNNLFFDIRNIPSGPYVLTITINEETHSLFIQKI